MSSRLFAALVLIATCATLVLAACGGTSTPTSHTLTFKQSDSAHTINLHTNQTFQVQLSGSGGTGYQWTYVDSDPSIVAQAGDSIYQNSSSAADSAATITFPFQALSSGRAYLTFTCARSWEVGIPPLRTIIFSIAVT